MKRVDLAVDNYIHIWYITNGRYIGTGRRPHYGYIIS